VTDSREGEGERGREGDSQSDSPSPPLPLSSSNFHTIRLRGPWEYQPLARATLLADGSVSLDERDLPAGGTIALPADWGETLGNDFRGLVRFTRRFAQPTGLDAATRVWLVIEDVDWQGTVTLNGHWLGQVQLAQPFRAPCLPVSPSLLPSLPSPTSCPARFDITSLLQPRNELTIDVLLPAAGAGTAPLARPGRETLPGGLIGLVRLEIEAL
jgi:hypothetical protein